MRLTVKKAIITLQSELPFLKEVKDAFYYHTRRLEDTPFSSMAARTSARSNAQR